MKLIEYHRLSNEERLREGATPFASQRAQTAAYLVAMGWESCLPLEEDDGVSTRRRLDDRPALSRTMARIAAGEADGFIATKVDRISRNTMEFLLLIEQAAHPKRGFALVALDLGVDTSTPAGKLLATVLAALAEWERSRISERTRDALAAKAAAGVVLGERSHRAPVLVSAEAEARLRELSLGGMSTRRIARQLAAEGFHTPRGGQWAHSTVAAVLSR